MYSWPTEKKNVSILSSFFSAIQQFANTYFSQTISLIGLEKENIMFLRHGEYILAISFSDRNEIPLVQRISRRILSEIKDVLSKSIDEIQFEQEKLALNLRSALARSGFFWLYEIASNVLKHENIMGLSIFNIRDTQFIEPLYYPIEPYLGFEKILRAVSSSIKVLNFLRKRNVEPLVMSFLSRNGNCIQAWFFNNLIAILEYFFRDISSIEKHIKNVLNNVTPSTFELVNETPFLELIFSLNIDVMADLPLFCQFKSIVENIIVDCSETEIKAYRVNPDVDITRLS